MPGWEQLGPDQQRSVSAELSARTSTDLAQPLPIPQLRAEVDACPTLLRKAVEELMRILDGERVVRVDVSEYFRGGVETEEQLEAALNGLREECERLIGAGKKIMIS